MALFQMKNEIFKRINGRRSLHKDLMEAQKVCDIINCAFCSKPRCVYANAKLSGNVKTNVDYLIADVVEVLLTTKVICAIHL